MVLEILIPCMHQKDFSIISKTGITGNVLLINQCDKNDYQISTSELCLVRMVSTTEWELSGSRNLSIRESQAEYVCSVMINSWSQITNR